ncbi:MAG: amidohydrolase family protein, partial [Chloroflexi bacterium]|nr:amidohydrolase family protein [Chloroflexota bacterium]
MAHDTVSTLSATIDADAHIIETERTWEYMTPSDAAFRPTLAPPAEAGARPRWMVEGEPRGFGAPSRPPGAMERRQRVSGRAIVTPEESAQMADVGARLRHMDEVGVDIQVLHTSFFIRPVTERAEVEVALCHSYNRWLADVTEHSDGRLRWSAVLPFLAIDEAVAELEWAVAHGACAVFMRPVEAHGIVTERYFYPVYEAAERLDVPIVMHVGNANEEISHVLGRAPGASAFTSFKLMLVACAHALSLGEVPSLFPKLRWGFLEAGAQWVPHVCIDMRERVKAPREGTGKVLSTTVIADNRMYMMYETYEDLSSILKYAGEANLVIGTDYGHTGQSAQIDAIRRLPER